MRRETHDDRGDDKVDGAQQRSSGDHHNDATRAAQARAVRKEGRRGVVRTESTHSPAMKRWNWMMNVSSEHWPKKMKNLELVERRNGVAFRRTHHARTGTIET